MRFIGDFLFFNCSVLSIREALKKVTEIIMKRFNCVSSRISCSNATYFSVVASILLTITLVSPLVDQTFITFIYLVTNVILLNYLLFQNYSIYFGVMLPKRIDIKVKFLFEFQICLKV